MKNHLGIYVNHSWPHCGGCETVVHELGKRLVSRGWMVSVFSESIFGGINVIDGVGYLPAHHYFANEQATITHINDKLTHLFVYSDLNKRLPYLLHQSWMIGARKFCATVGANHLRGGRTGVPLWEEVKRNGNKERWHFIAHSKHTGDAVFLESNGADWSVIPNGVDLAAMKLSETRQSFSENEGIYTPYMLLCVSNMYEGKGQDHLLNVLNILSERRQDITAVFMASSIQDSYLDGRNSLFREVAKHCKIPVKCMFNAPRKNIVNAFHAADLFVLPSVKEVAPLTILEAMAAKLPWLSLLVGNVEELAGGSVIHTFVDEFDGASYSTQVYQHMADEIDLLLNSPNVRAGLGHAGHQQVEKELNWDQIADKYERLFIEGKVNG